MGSTFNPQILVEKLTKLNSSQQSIETLSHWCIFHMNKAKLVVETWEKQFHCSPRDRRLPFLYLANDILQNSRRKGSEFVAEFWRVLPEALREVIQNGDDADRKAARRLINIWDERKVFGSHGHILKEEFVGKQSENTNTNGRQPNTKQHRQSFGTAVGKMVSEFEMLYGDELDEDALLSKCASTTSTLEKTVKDFGSGLNSGKVGGSTEEIQGKHASVKECIEQLTALESSRASLVSHLRDALREEESKLDQLRSLLQVAQSTSDQFTNVFQQLTNSDNMVSDEQGSFAPPGITAGERQETPVVYTTQAPLSNNKATSSEDEARKSAAAAVAAKLAASTSSAQMLSLALTSLVSGVAFGTNINSNNNNLSGAHKTPDDHQLEKRAKHANDTTSYVLPSPVPPPGQQQNQQLLPPLPPFPNPEQNSSSNTPTTQQVTPHEQPLLPSSSPSPMAPLPSIMQQYHPMPPEFMQTAGSMSNVAYAYGATPQPQSPLCAPAFSSEGASMTGMSPYGPQGNPYQPYQVSESGFCSPPSNAPGSMSHQPS